MTASGIFRQHVGHGPPIVVVHGGPEFDHTYMRPELDNLADSFRLVYYDQRGRGRSAGGVSPEDVSIDSEVDDLDDLTADLELETLALLGHSWGGLVAMEYAVRHPERVSHLILLNTAPVSYLGRLAFAEHLAGLRSPENAEALARLRETDEFRRGDLEADAAYFRIHFRADGSAPSQVERLVGRLRTHFTPETVLLSRAIEQRLSEQTWLRDDYDLVPALASLAIPTLLVHGDRDFIPVEIARHIAETIPGAQLAVLPDCGHFAFMDHPGAVLELIESFHSDSLQPPNR